MFISEEIENFMEALVEDEIRQLDIHRQHDEDYLKDLYCITLNSLPPKYVRYSLDVRMNMTSSEAIEMSNRIREAIDRAQTKLANDPRKNREL